MFDVDAIFNNIIFLIPVAIVVTRLISRARAKKAPPPKKPPQPYIPVHFEENTDDDLAYFKNRNEEIEAPKRAQTSKRKTQKSVAAPFTPKAPLSQLTQVPPIAVKTAGVAPAPQNNFSFNLNHLSPLKQAVVMSEILGQPKGMM